MTVKTHLMYQVDVALSLAAVVSDQNEVLFTDIFTKVEKHHS
jgi:hypothetical protein